jgi:ATP-dependent DNA helicase RecG
MGVTDDGMIVGVNSDRAETLKKNIINSIKNTELFLPCPYFTPQILGVDDKVVLYLEIPCGEYVYRFKGRYWDRNGDADIDVTDQPELLLSLFERKNPHLFEERTVEGLTMEHLDHATFQYSRNVIAARKPAHPWLQMTDEQILLSTHLAKRSDDDKLLLKYAALILFGKEDAIVELMPRYRFEALFHMCTYAQYNDMKQFPNRYDDRRTMRQNLILVYQQLAEFVERYLPDRFYLPEGSKEREDLRWNLFREIVGNLCVHTDFSSGYACFFHVFKDRVVTKNPTRLLPEIPEGEMKIEQLDNYTKNPLLVRVFHEMLWAEDMGSGTRNILRYAPLYYPGYKIEINNGSQFLFSITYMDANVPESKEMSETNVRNEGKMSLTDMENVHNTTEMSETNVRNEIPLNEEELSVKIEESGAVKEKKNRRRQGIISLIAQNSGITIEMLADKLGTNEKTIRRDLTELREQGVIKRVGGSRFGGHWEICKK